VGNKPPTLSVAATSSAQKYELMSLFRGHTIDRAMATLEKGFPRCCIANRSIFTSDA
jgi:hypothetical protein